jgi:hypothetical protein
MIDIRGVDEFEFAAAAGLSQQPEAGTAAQQFRQLLQAAMSRLGVSTRELVDKGHEPLAMLIDEAAGFLDRAALLAHQLAPTPSPAGPAPEFVLVQQLIVSAGDRLRRTLGGAIRLQTCVSGGAPAVRCAPRLLEKILIDLAINARGAMPDGGLLLIESRTRSLRGSQPHAPVVCVTVTGTAETKAPATHPERTVRVGFLKEPDRAWSTGFRDVQLLVEKIGGVAEFERLPGGGGCVRLHLPARADRS